MVGDRDVLEAALDRSNHHVAERRLAVASGGVHVQVALKVGHFNQLWQLALSAAQANSCRVSRVFGAEPGRPTAA